MKSRDGEPRHALILAGGLSPKRNASLESGRRVHSALTSVGVDARIADADSALLGAIKAAPPDVVFPMTHGVGGEDGSIQEILSLANIPYVGTTPSSCRLAFNKPTAKTIISAAGVSTPASVVLHKDLLADLGTEFLLEQVITELGLPLFVKPASGGSALGATRVSAPEELLTAMIACFAYGDIALVERCVVGIEVSVSVLDLGEGPTALPAVEIHPVSGVYDYTTRYTAGHRVFHVPARLPPKTAADVTEAAITAHRALGMRDLSRTDLIVDDGRVMFLETNVTPGMTETSPLPMAIEAAGLTLGAVCRDLLKAATRHG